MASRKREQMVWQTTVAPSQSVYQQTACRRMPTNLKVSQYQPNPSPASSSSASPPPRAEQAPVSQSRRASRSHYGNMAFKVSPQRPVEHNALAVAGKNEKRPLCPTEEMTQQSKRSKTGFPTIQKRREKGNLQATGASHLPQMHIDALHQILLRAHPSTLLKARLVCHDLNELLKASSIWRDCRQNYYGNDLPGPPPGMEEWQFTDLISGNTCMKCGSESIRKKYWAFCRRWCLKCFKASTLPETAVRSILTEHGDLRSCIISASVDGYGGYMCVDLARDPRRHRLYLNSDVRKIVVDFDQFKATLGTLDDHSRDRHINTWIETKREAIRQIATHLRSIEVWGTAETASKTAKNIANKRARAKYFQEQATTLDPPLDNAALELIPSYLRSVAICGPPSHSAWVHLRPKVEKERIRAEEIIQIEQRIKGCVPNYWTQLSAIEKDREAYLHPEQRLVLELTDQALMEISAFSIASPEVFTLQILNRVWEKYESIPIAERPDRLCHQIEFFSDLNATARYVLSLQDVIMVYEQKVFPYLRTDGESERTQKFRCPGCTRKDMKSLLGLRDLFRHLKDVHARKDAGDFWTMRLGGLDEEKVYLCAIPWPRNLPILPPHQDASGTYDPNAVPSYEPITPTSIPSNPNLEIPSNRNARSFYPEKLSHKTPEEIFIYHIDFALQSLHRTSLEPPFQAKIAMKYALELWMQHFLAENTISKLPPLSVLQNLSLHFIRKNDFTSFTGLRCGFCVKSKLKNNAPRVHGRLLEHLKNTRRHDHHRHEWATTLFAFPTDRLLWDKLSAPDMANTLTIYNHLFPPSKPE